MFYFKVHEYSNFDSSMFYKRYLYFGWEQYYFYFYNKNILV